VPFTSEYINDNIVIEGIFSIAENLLDTLQHELNSTIPLRTERVGLEGDSI